MKKYGYLFALMFLLPSLVMPMTAYADFIKSTYGFRLNVSGGSLNGTVQTGQYSFDLTQVTGSGPESIALHDFQFPFNGYTFTLADAISATASFDSGNLLGVNYVASSISPDQSISFQSGFFSLSEQTFSYSLAGTPEGGAGEPGNEIITSQAKPNTRTRYALVRPNVRRSPCSRKSQA